MDVLVLTAYTTGRTYNGFSEIEFCDGLLTTTSKKCVNLLLCIVALVTLYRSYDFGQFFQWSKVVSVLSDKEPALQMSKATLNICR